MFITRLIVESIHTRLMKSKRCLRRLLLMTLQASFLNDKRRQIMKTLTPVTQLPNVSSSVDAHVPSQQELDLLFDPLYDEFFVAGKITIIKQKKNTYKTMNLPILSVHRYKKLLSLPHTALESTLGIETSSKGVAKYALEILHKHGMDKGQSIDADHAGCIDTRKSTSGGIQFIGDKLVSWMSKKQDCNAISSAEAEYVALSKSCAQ
nr:Gag-Pol polyprotein [Tanacetum cinerariifolium]